MIKLFLSYNRKTSYLMNQHYILLICRCRFLFSSDKPDQEGGDSDAGGPSAKPGTSKTSQKKKDDSSSTNKKVKNLDYIISTFLP